jgi:hypothetical protein
MIGTPTSALALSLGLRSGWDNCRIIMSCKLLIGRIDFRAPSLQIVQLLLNGFDPHIPRYDFHQTSLFVGTTIDEMLRLLESIDEYSLGEIYEPRVDRVVSFGKGMLMYVNYFSSRIPTHFGP